MTFCTEQNNEKDGSAPKQLTDIYTPLFTLRRSLCGTKASGGRAYNWKKNYLRLNIILLKIPTGRRLQSQLASCKRGREFGLGANGRVWVFRLRKRIFIILSGCLLLFRPNVVLVLYQRNRGFWKREWEKEKPKNTKLRRQLPRNMFMSRYINTLNKLTCILGGTLFIRLHFGYKINSCLY